MFILNSSNTLQIGLFRYCSKCYTKHLKNQQKFALLNSLKSKKKSVLKWQHGFGRATDRKLPFFFPDYKTQCHHSSSPNGASIILIKTYI